MTEGKPEEVDETEEDEEKNITATLVDKATAAADRMEQAEANFAKQLDRQEALRVKNILGGETDAGSTHLTKEQKENAAAKSMLEGSGMDPFAGAGADALKK